MTDRRAKAGETSRAIPSVPQVERVLEADSLDFLAEIRGRGASALSDRRPAPRGRVGLPMDTPFRIQAEALGAARLHRLRSSPYGFLLLTPTVLALLEHEVQRYRLFLGTALDSRWFVFPAAVDGFLSEVERVELVAVAQAVDEWRVVSSPRRGERVIGTCKDYGAPLFPSDDPEKLVRTAFADRTIDDHDDARIDALAGRYGERS